MENGWTTPAAIVGGLAAVGLGAFLVRRRSAAASEASSSTEIAYPTPDLSGPLGSQLQRAKDAGWLPLFEAAERAHAIPLGVLAAVASRETNMKDIIGDEGHGRGLMQIDDRSHGSWLKAHGAGDNGTPTVADAIDYAGKLVADSIAYGVAQGVADADLLKFGLSAYNAGGGGALSGYKTNGDSDAHTTGKDYGRDVLKRWREMFPAQGDPAMPAQPQVAGWAIAGSSGMTLAQALATLLQQVDTIWPHRSTASDGAMADTDEPDHSSGNAIDITNDPTNGPDLDALAEELLGDPRTHYVIFNSRIANRDVDGGAWRPYPEREPGETIGDYEQRAKDYNKHSRHIHISIRRSGRADASLWPKGAKDNARLAAATREAPLPAPASTERLPELLKRGIVGLWNDGLVDNFRWIPLHIGHYDIEVTADAAAAYGLRLPASFDDMLEIAGSVGDIIPPTKAISDARWSAASKRIVLPPISGGAHKSDGIDPVGVQQVQQWDAELGPVSAGPLYDGGWKEWILEPGIAEGQAVNYGLRGKNGNADAVWQSPGHGHDDKWLDYSQLATFVKRAAKKNGKPVDLLDELASGAPELIGGPLPRWIVDRLNGGS